MGKWIDTDAAYAVLTDYYHHSTDAQHAALKEALEMVPTVDAVPARHGRWIAGSVPTYAVCNRCAYQERFAYENNFCPNCGAKMDGKDGDYEKANLRR